MKKTITTTTLLLGIVLFGATAIAPVIPAELSADIREGTGTLGQSKQTVDGVTANALPQNVELRVDFGGADQRRKASFQSEGGKGDQELSPAGYTAHALGPSLMVLLGLGLIGLAGVGRKLTKNSPQH